MARQAGAEIEVTSEMLTAGMHELLDYDKEGDDPRLTVRWIFEAMMGVAPKARLLTRE